MFVIGRPTEEDLDRVLAGQLSEDVTYAAVGATRGTMPAGYRHDEHVIVLGREERVFARAVDGLRGWAAHRGAGLKLRPENPDLEEGLTVVLAVALLGISVVAACRIVYVVDEPDTFGFAYGTLPVHPEEGEEAFIVRRQPDGTVRFVITVFSRPRHPLARLGGPFSRRIQLETTRRYLHALKTYSAD